MSQRVQVSVEGPQAILVILALGAVLRLATLGRQSLWLDEGVSFWVANRPWGDILSYLPGHDSHPPMYYLLLSPVLALGHAEWVLRLPSALLGLGGIAIMAVLGTELFDRRTGLLAALILAVTPIQVWYSQEARMYALVGLLALASVLFAVRAVRGGRRADWVLLVLSESLALWTDYSGIWIVLALNAAALFAWRELRRRERVWAWLGAQAMAVVLFAPWIPTFAQDAHSTAGWIPPSTIRDFVRTMADFAGGFGLPTLLAVVPLLAVLAGLALGGQHLRREAERDRFGAWLLVCWFAVPIGLSFLISQRYLAVPLLSLLSKPGHSVFLTRNLLVASYPLYLVLARCLLVSRRQVLVGVLAVLAVMAGVAYGRDNVQGEKDDFRGAARVVAAERQPQDLVVFAPPYVELPFDYYFVRRHTGGFPMSAVMDGVITRAPRRTYSASSVRRLVERSTRVWFVSNLNQVQSDALGVGKLLAQHDRPVQQRRYRGVTVTLYRSRG